MYFLWVKNVKPWLDRWSVNRKGKRGLGRAESGVRGGRVWTGDQPRFDIEVSCSCCWEDSFRLFFFWMNESSL